MTTPSSAKRTYNPETIATLERYGFSDPHDPRFIWISIFGSRMRGHRQRWPRIDFDELAQVNPDVCGWIHMDGSPVNYPIVASRLDSGHYLTHNFSGERSCHGQVALGFMCGGVVGGRNTPLLAHTMKDWSMFRAVRALCDQAYLDEHPTVEVLTPSARYSARWFAAARWSSSDPWTQRARFADDADFRAWLDRILEGNWLRTDLVPDTHSQILTCSMCAKTPGPYDRRALFAVLSDERRPEA